MLLLVICELLFGRQSVSRLWYVRRSLCAVKRRYVPERVVLFSQVTVLARNTPKPNSTVGSWNALRTSKVGCGIGATQDTVLPSSLYSNLIWSRVQID